jgi:transcriptional regulator with GAF, ATPase, and Fis domain
VSLVCDNQIFPDNLSLVCIIIGSFSNCTFQGSIREFETFIKIKVLRYLNNTHCIYSKSNKPSHFVQSLDMRTSILSLQKVIYILKQLIIRPGNCFAMSNQIFPENLSLVCKITGSFSNCTFQGSIRESETFIKIKVLRYLNNIHCIIDIVLCWSIKVIYILKQLIIGPGNCLQKYCN